MDSFIHVIYHAPLNVALRARLVNSRIIYPPPTTDNASYPPARGVAIHPLAHRGDSRTLEIEKSRRQNWGKPAPLALSTLEALYYHDKY